MVSKKHKSLFRALANSTRLEILLALRKGELNVSEIMCETGQKQSTISHNLQKLMSEGLVRVRSEGPFRYFSLEPSMMLPIIELMEKNSESDGQKAKKELSEAKQRLGLAENTLKSVMGSAPIGMVYIDAKGDITMLEGKALENLSLRPGAIIGKNVWENHPDEKTGRKIWKQIMDGEEFCHTSKTDDRWFESRYNRVLDAKGKPVGMVGVGIDITDQKKAQDELALLKNITLETAGAADLDAALTIILNHFCKIADFTVGQAWLPSVDGTVVECSNAWKGSDTSYYSLRDESLKLKVLPGDSFVTEALRTKGMVWLEDVKTTKKLVRRESAIKDGLLSALAVPLISGDKVVAVLEFFRMAAGPKDHKACALATDILLPFGKVIEHRRRESDIVRSERELREMIKSRVPGRP